MSNDNAAINEYLEKSKALGSTYGLTAICALLRILGNPQDQIPIIHVAGTNGKGSICAFLSAIFQKAGYQCGVYTSPAVFSYYERFRINGADITEDRFLNLRKEVIENALNAGILVSIFELETVIAYLYFARENCGIAVMEAGCGGLMDATNVTAHPLAVCYSSIGMDHRNLLGDTLAQIATNKAGLIKEGTLAVSAPQITEVRNALDNKAASCSVSITYAKESMLTLLPDGQMIYRGLPLTLCSPGAFQPINAVTAVELILSLNETGFSDISAKCIAAGVKSVIVPGRFECLAHGIYIDGAHNEPAIRMLRKTLETNFTNPSFTFIIGVFRDKEYENYLPLIVPMASEIITISTSGPRAFSAASLAAVIRTMTNMPVRQALNLQDAAAKAREDAARGRTVVFFGSLSRLADFKKALQESEKGEQGL